MRSTVIPYCRRRRPQQIYTHIAKFYYLKGQALYANGSSSNDDINAAIESFNMAKDVEAKTGKSKYTSSIDELKKGMLEEIGKLSMGRVSFLQDMDVRYRTVLITHVSYGRDNKYAA